MKNLYILFTALISLGVINAQTTTLTFEDGTAFPDPAAGGAADNTSSVVVDPTDANNKVLKIQYGVAGSWDNWGGFVIPVGDAQMKTTTGISFKLWTPALTDGLSYGYLWKMEGDTPNMEKSFSASHDGTWENVTIDFSTCVGAPGNCNAATTTEGVETPNHPDGEWKKLVIHHWGGSNPSSPLPETIYIDDITFTSGSNVVAPPVPQSVVEASFDGSDFQAFDGPTYTETNGLGTIQNINGATSGANTNPWGHIQHSPIGGFDFSTSDRGVAIRVKGPRSVSVKVKFEANNFEVDQTYDDVGNFQTLYYDLSSQSTETRQKVIIFFEINTEASADLADDLFEINRFSFGEFATLSDHRVKLIKDVSLYPNPVRDVMNISAGESIQRVRVYDLTGRMVKQANPNTADFSLDVADLSKGVYFVKLNAGDREATTKLIK